MIPGCTWGWLRCALTDAHELSSVGASPALPEPHGYETSFESLVEQVFADAALGRASSPSESIPSDDRMIVNRLRELGYVE